MHHPRLAFLLLLVLAACRSGTDHGGSQFVAPQPSPQDPLETISKYEDARTDGDGLLQSLLHTGNTRTREHAATALGRLDPADFGTEVTDGLALALTDESASVRAAAAFALGERADSSAAGPLLAHWHDPDPLVRSRIVEAGSRIDDPRLRVAVLASLDDPDPNVRSEAVVGASRFPVKRTDALDAEGVLVEFLMRPPSVTKPAPEADNYWRALFTFSRNKSPRTDSVLDGVRNVCTAALSSSDVRARIFAAKALAEIPAREVSSAALTTALRDQDWRVACEAAVALGQQDASNAVNALGDALKHPSPHVRRAACQALGSPRLQGDRGVSAMLASAGTDSSPEVRAAALGAQAELLGHDALERVFDASVSKDPLARAAAASAAVSLPANDAVPLLVELSNDRDVRVAGIAVEGLQQHPLPFARGQLLYLLSSADNGLRLAAVTALDKGKMLTADDVPALRACLESSSGEISGELAAALVDAAVSVGKAGSPIVQLALVHPDPHVRKKAAALTTSSDAVPPARPERATETTSRDRFKPAINPRVEVKTNRGTMTFELFPAEAPNHVRNFLELASRHHYDGLTFHRVELDFVVQGGDHRGDGNGGITWNGAPLRAEFTPRKYVRGSLGMPRNDDPDSGGSQFFVTHRDTPHLDGRYTNFGQLVAGFDTLDSIEVGDTIESVRVVPVQ